MSCQLFHAKCCSQAPGKHNSFIFQMSVAGQLLRTFPPNTGTLDRHNQAVLAASLIPESRASTVRTEVPLFSAFLFQASTLLCSPSNLFYSATSIFTSVQQGFDRGISGILKMPRRCLHATTGSCCDIQTINGTLQALSSGGL